MSRCSRASAKVSGMRRSSFLSLHRWVALAFAPFLLLQATTGAILVIHDALVASSRADARSLAPVTALVTGAGRDRPGFRVTRLYMPGAQTRTAFAELADPRGHAAYAALDPETGRAIRTGTVWAFPAVAALQLHHHLADGRIGMAVVLANGLALLTLAGSGLLFWWPGQKKALPSLAIRSNLPGRFRLRQWHKTVGVALSLVVVFSATTGILLITPDLAAPGAPRSASVPPRTPAQVESAVAVAQARFPEARLRDIRFPAADRLDVSFFAPETNMRAVHIVSVRPSDGAILRATPAGQNDVLWMKVMPLHAGNSFGPVGILVLLAEGMALSFLGCAGIVMWAQSRPKKKVR